MLNVWRVMLISTVAVGGTVRFEAVTGPVVTLAPTVKVVLSFVPWMQQWDRYLMGVNFLKLGI